MFGNSRPFSDCVVIIILQTPRMQFRSEGYYRWFYLFVFLVGISASAAGLPAIKLTPAFPNLHFNRPLWMEEIPDDSHRLIVVEQDGRILIFPQDSAVKEAKTFLDISPRKPHIENEEGLLAFAFHPQYRTNGLFYIDYVQQSPKRSLLSEFRVPKTDSNVAELGSELVLMHLSQPYWNHKGGTMVFGPDGYLYVSFGDGGAGAGLVAAHPYDAPGSFTATASGSPASVMTQRL